MTEPALTAAPVERLVRLEAALAKCRQIIDRVDNGRCMICGTYRSYNVPGGRLVRGYKLCENSECLSHELRDLLGE